MPMSQQNFGKLSIKFVQPVLRAVRGERDRIAANAAVTISKESMKILYESIAVVWSGTYIFQQFYYNNSQRV